MEDENTSKSAPPLFSEDPSSKQIIDLEDKITPDKDKSSSKVHPKSLSFSNNMCEKPDFESRTIVADSDKLETENAISASHSKILKKGPSETSSQDIFKVPALPEISEKYSNPQQSPDFEMLSTGISKLATEGHDEKSSSDCPRRPRDFNVSPRQFFYTFCPTSPLGLIRHCRSLPNTSQAPRKDMRRSSIDFGNYRQSSSVKALFTGELKNEPTTPESFMSLVCVEDIEGKIISESETDNSSDKTKHCSPEQQNSNSKCFSQISNSNNSNLDKPRKKLIFVSPCKNTNVFQTLQESSSSSDIYRSISNLTLTDSAESDLKMVECPAKRKSTSPNVFNEDCSDIPSKKLRLSFEPEYISSKSSQMTDEKLHSKRKHSAIDNEGMLKEVSDEKMNQEEFHSNLVTNVIPTCSASGDTKTDTSSIIELHKDSESSLKSVRGSVKRVLILNPDSVEDIELEAKRGKKSV